MRAPDAAATAQSAKPPTTAAKHASAAPKPPTAAVNNAPPTDGADLAASLRAAGLEVIDKRPIGRLWVVDNNPPSPAFAAVLKRGARFVFASNGSRTTKQRPAWFQPGT